MDSLEIDNSMESFMTLFNKMFTETKYNLQALNKRMESMDKCFNNVLLLSSDKPFDELNEEDEENNENINIDNYHQKKENYNTTHEYKKQRKSKGKMTSKELDEIEKMFKDIEDPNENVNTYFIGKKRTNTSSIPALGTDPKNYCKDIQELLKNYSLDADDKKDEHDKPKEQIQKEDNVKKSKGRGRKKSRKNKDNSSESNAEDVDYLVPEKNDGYTKFKEFKELKKKMNTNEYKNYSDEDDDEDLDSDL